MKRKLTIYTMSLALVGLTLSSCGKYEDGPGFTLLTKKARLTGIWDEKEEVGTDGTVYPDNGTGTIEFTKSETVILKEPSLSLTMNGTWEFASDKEKLRVTFTVGSSSSTDEYTIRRLTNKELWIADPDGYQYRYEKVK